MLTTARRRPRSPRPSAARSRVVVTGSCRPGTTSSGRQRNDAGRPRTAPRGHRPWSSSPVPGRPPRRGRAGGGGGGEHSRCRPGQPDAAARPPSGSGRHGLFVTASATRARQPPQRRGAPRPLAPPTGPARRPGGGRSSAPTGRTGRGMTGSAILMRSAPPARVAPGPREEAADVLARAPHHVGDLLLVISSMKRTRRPSRARRGAAPEAAGPPTPGAAPTAPVRPTAGATCSSRRPRGSAVAHPVETQVGVTRYRNVHVELSPLTCRVVDQRHEELLEDLARLLLVAEQHPRPSQDEARGGGNSAATSSSAERRSFARTIPSPRTWSRQSRSRGAPSGVWSLRRSLLRRLARRELDHDRCCPGGPRSRACTSGSAVDVQEPDPRRPSRRPPPRPRRRRAARPPRRERVAVLEQVVPRRAWCRRPRRLGSAAGCRPSAQTRPWRSRAKHSPRGDVVDGRRCTRSSR